jgi:hypothetical protein
VALFNINVYVDAKKRRKLHWTVGPVSEQKLSGPGGRHMNIQLTDSQQAELQVTGADKKGFPATATGFAFTSSDDTVAAVTQDATDPSKALLVAGNPGTAQVIVTGDGSVSGTLDVVVVAGPAATIAITPGTPVEQP